MIETNQPQDVPLSMGAERPDGSLPDVVGPAGRSTPPDELSSESGGTDYVLQGRDAPPGRQEAAVPLDAPAHAGATAVREAVAGPSSASDEGTPRPAPRDLSTVSILPEKATPNEPSEPAADTGGDRDDLPPPPEPPEGGDTAGAGDGEHQPLASPEAFDSLNQAIDKLPGLPGYTRTHTDRYVYEKIGDPNGPHIEIDMAHSDYTNNDPAIRERPVAFAKVQYVPPEGEPHETVVYDNGDIRPPDDLKAPLAKIEAIEAVNKAVKAAAPPEEKDLRALQLAWADNVAQTAARRHNPYDPQHLQQVEELLARAPDYGVEPNVMARSDHTIKSGGVTIRHSTYDSVGPSASSADIVRRVEVQLPPEQSPNRIRFIEFRDGMRQLVREGPGIQQPPYSKGQVEDWATPGLRRPGAHVPTETYVRELTEKLTEVITALGGGGPTPPSQPGQE
jgi:hypothetical protein